MTITGFEKFYSQWLEEEKALLDPLRNSVESQKSDTEITSLVDRCYRHYSKYVDAKIKVAQEDVAYVAAGMWRTPLEAGFVWMGGWRPTAAVILAYSLMGLQIENELRRLLDGIDVPSMSALSAKQLARLNCMQQQTKDAEDDISNRLAILQMLVADQQMARATTAEPPPSESCNLSEVREAIESKLLGLRDLLIEAEQLRLETLHEMISILTPVQAAQYTIAAFEMAIAVRKLGDQEREMYSLESSQSKAQKNIWELASQGQMWELQEAVQAGIDPFVVDYEGRTPLHVAAAKGHTEAVSFLVEHGANVNERDDLGNTPLVDALKGGHDATALILVQSGAETNTQEVGIELCKAAATGDIGYVTKMVKLGVDPNVTDYTGSTPLHFVAAEGHHEAVGLLVQEGADVLAKDRSVHIQPISTLVLICYGAPLLRGMSFDRKYLSWALDYLNFIGMASLLWMREDNLGVPPLLEFWKMNWCVDRIWVRKTHKILKRNLLRRVTQWRMFKDSKGLQGGRKLMLDLAVKRVFARQLSYQCNHSHPHIQTGAC